MGYTVIAKKVIKGSNGEEYLDLHPAREYIAKNSLDAKNKAKEYANELSSEHEVFIEYYKKSDGYSGYLNRDDISNTGKSWRSQLGE